MEQEAEAAHSDDLPRVIDRLPLLRGLSRRRGSPMLPEPDAREHRSASALKNNQ